MMWMPGQTKRKKIDRYVINQDQNWDFCNEIPTN